MIAPVVKHLVIAKAEEEKTNLYCFINGYFQSKLWGFDVQVADFYTKDDEISTRVVLIRLR